ncbi:MAG: DNA gyrase/topoisomerase IV subunit A, partial [Candidatus Woesearchaeota archaeon]
MADKNLKAEVIDTSLTKELKKSYIDYAMSVIVSRAIPDVRDGLKPVHRRILYSMGDMSLYHTRGHKKCARVVGEVLGKYHPHGDTSVYNALVRMAQTFSLRYPLVDGQGNFGSIDGDSPAAMRYTESRLQKISKFMLKDINKNTVDFRPNFDESLKEPVVLPSKFPNLLVNGSSGIAVGMATSVLPHNMTEICDAVVYMLDQDYDEVKPTDLMNFVSGPDFPTGGKVLGRDGILKAYETGHGKVRVRGVIEKEEKRSKTKLIITEIPYMVKKSDIIKEIAELVKEDRIKGIRDLKDESNRKGIRVVIDLKNNANPDLVINHIFKNTRMEKTLSMIHQVLVDGKPRLLNLKDMIYEFIKHRKDVIKRRTQFLLTKAENRLHIVKGLIIALDSIDEVVNLIKSSDNVESAKESLISKYKLDEKQSESILQMRLQKLTSLEQKTLREEKESLEGEVKHLKGILNSEEKIKQIIKDETKEIVDEFGDDRKTEIIEDYRSITRKDLVKKEEIVITLTNKGYLKRVPLKEYRVQGRGGKGVLASNVSDEEFIKNTFAKGLEKAFGEAISSFNLSDYQSNKDVIKGINIYSKELADLNYQQKQLAKAYLPYNETEKYKLVNAEIEKYKEGLNDIVDTLIKAISATDTLNNATQRIANIEIDKQISEMEIGLLGLKGTEKLQRELTDIENMKVNYLAIWRDLQRGITTSTNTDELMNQIDF